MRDLFVVLILISGCVLTLHRAWLGVLVLAFFGYANPHRYAWGFSTDLPVYQIILIVAFLAFFQSHDRQKIPRDWRIVVFYMLWAWFVVTTMASPLGAIAWNKLWEVSKVYIPLILTLYLINTPRKLFWLLATIGFSFGLLAAKGGVFALQHGFQYRVWGPEGTMYGGNNEFSIATLAAIPLLILVFRQLKNSKSRWERILAWIAALCTPLAVASAISSWSRGGLLALAALFTIVWWNSKRKILLSAVAALAILYAPNFLPEDWFARMETIKTYEDDLSAMGRIWAWRDGLAYLRDHPVLGGGFDGWRYITQRDWHSSYVEILVEHGVPGAALWGALMFGTLLSLTRLIRRAKKASLVLERDMAMMIRASIIAYLAGSTTLGITYWDLIYQLVFCAILLKAFIERQVPSTDQKQQPGTPSRQ